MSAGPQRVVETLVEAGGRTAHSFGFSRLIGRIYAYLFCCETPQSLTDIASALGVSKASASIACRQMQTWGAVRRVTVDRDRRDYYEAETDMGQWLAGGILPALDRKLESAGTVLRQSLDKIGDGGNGGDLQYLRDRLAQADSRRERLQSVLRNPLIKRVL